MTKLALGDVTLVSVSSVNLDETQLALLMSSRHIDFGAIKLISSGLPSRLAAHIEYVAAPPMDILGYSRFVLGQLHRHVQTPYCLLVQADGFVLASDLWSPEFLEYDYVGAPWPERLRLRPGNETLIFDRNRVGNGGFSLRSRKLLETAARIDFDALEVPMKSEDLIIGHYLYHEMKAQGIRFAPVEVAARFSLESPEPGQHSAFGFHGRWLCEALFKDAGFSSDAAAVTNALSASVGPFGRNSLCPCGSGRKYKQCHGMLG
jgi:hypothetical protein